MVVPWKDFCLVYFYLLADKTTNTYRYSYDFSKASWFGHWFKRVHHWYCWIYSIWLSMMSSILWLDFSWRNCQVFLSQQSAVPWLSEHKLAKHAVLLTSSELLHILFLFIVFASWQAFQWKSWYDLMTSLTWGV